MSLPSLKNPLDQRKYNIKKEKILFENIFRAYRNQILRLTFINIKPSTIASIAKQIVTIIIIKPTRIFRPPDANTLIIRKKPLEKKRSQIHTEHEFVIF